MGVLHGTIHGLFCRAAFSFARKAKGFSPPSGNRLQLVQEEQRVLDSMAHMYRGKRLAERHASILCWSALCSLLAVFDNLVQEQSVPRANALASGQSHRAGVLNNRTFTETLTLVAQCLHSGCLAFASARPAWERRWQPCDCVRGSEEDARELQVCTIGCFLC